jgi:serine protease
MSPILLVCVLAPSVGLAASHRGPFALEQARIVREGRLSDTAIVKLKDGLVASVQGGVIEIRNADPNTARNLGHLRGLLREATVAARFSASPEELRAMRQKVDPTGRLADLNLYFRVESAQAPKLVAGLRANPLVESAWLAFAPEEPPSDIPPTTPDFSGMQSYAGPAPWGLGFDEARRWPGASGENVSIADIEYSWDASHEDLDNTTSITTSGWDCTDYRYHGNSVLGELVAPDNGYGVTGLVPGATPLVVHPYTNSRTYDVADAIVRALPLLQPGDVILIEQQAYMFDSYCPIEVDPGVFDAIALAVASGVVVVEPGGNGGQDLDDEHWKGFFDRRIQDSGAIMVGGGASPLSPFVARAWYPDGSSFGSRVDVQGWYDAIATATTGEYGGWFADLYYPDSDARQAYTQSFGGTSGASPMVTAVAAAFQSVAIAVLGRPVDPLDLREMISTTGSPQAESDEASIGSLPDLRLLLRSCLSP